MVLDKETRLYEIEKALRGSAEPISGDSLAKTFSVSRQVIVQDISLLRAKNIPIHSTNRGYYMDAPKGFRRNFKCHHRDDEITKELNLIVDLGAIVEDVYVEHRFYGKIAATLNIQSRKDVNHFMDDIYHSVSTPLNNITDGYHFHTVFAKDEETLNEVEAALAEAGFLVPEEPFKEEA